MHPARRRLWCGRGGNCRDIVTSGHLSTDVAAATDIAVSWRVHAGAAHRSPGDGDVSGRAVVARPMTTATRDSAVRVGPPEPVGPPPKRSGVGWREWILAAVLLLPNLALLIVFTYRPLLDNIRLSFTDWNISAPIANSIGLSRTTPSGSAATTRGSSSATRWSSPSRRSASRWRRAGARAAAGPEAPRPQPRPLGGVRAVRHLRARRSASRSSSSSTRSSGSSATCSRGSASRRRTSTRTSTGRCSW